MTLLRELIKLFGLGIVSLILIGTAMADDTKIMNLINDIKDVKQEYDPKSFEFKIPNELIATVALAETGNMQFKGAPTAEAANNLFGIHPYGNQPFLATQGGSKLTKFNTPKDSIRAFINLIKTQDEYEPVRTSINQGNPIEEHFKGLSLYAEKEDYPDFLNQVYKTRVFRLFNPILPKRKPMNMQMDNLK